MVEDKGEIPFDKADEANIPVNIWLLEEKDDDDDNKTGRWELTASNYTPRKGVLYEGVYKATADSRDELADLIREHIIPLYETAVKKLQAVCEGGAKGLYYWSLRF